MHQLHEREAAAVLQPPHVRPGARGIPEGGHRLDFHRLRDGPSSLHRSHRKGISGIKVRQQGNKASRRKVNRVLQIIQTIKM